MPQIINMRDIQNQAVPTILLALRHATHNSHKSLEKLTPFFQADFDRAAYLRWLDLMHGFYRMVDHVVLRSRFSVTTHWQYQPRCGLISRDIASLADRLPSESYDPSDILADIMKLNQTGEVAGMLYVVEGSALGGQIIMKTLQLKVGVTDLMGATFFLPYGNSPHSNWAEYVQLLAELTVNSEQDEAVIYGAVTTFNTLQNWVKQEWRG